MYAGAIPLVPELEQYATLTCLTRYSVVLLISTTCSFPYTETYRTFNVTKPFDLSSTDDSPIPETTFHTRRRTAYYVTLKEQRKLDTNLKIVGKDVTVYSTKSWMPLLISYCDINTKQVGHDTGAAWCYKKEYTKIIGDFGCRDGIGRT